MATSLHARKRADLLSLAGAILIGVAAGAWCPAAVRPVLLPILAAGLLAHAVGMTARHRLDQRAGPLPGMWQWLYILCWIAIAAILILGAWRRFGGPH